MERSSVGSISSLLIWGVMDYAIYMLDPEGRVMSWNTGAERIKGYAAEEIIGQHFSCFYTEEDRAHGLPEQVLKTAFERGHYAAEGWRCRKDGSRFWASVVVSPVHEDDKLIGFAKVTRDLTEQRAMEVALRDERANAVLREQFIAVLGHDLRNPLAAMLAGAQLLMKMPLNDRAVALVRMMEDSGQRMSALIDDVLDFARGRLGGGLLLDRNANAPVEATLRQVVAELTASAPDRVVEMEFNLAEPINCDLSRIAQLCSNLLGNAHTHGSTTEPIRVRAVSGAGCFELSVSNAGEPIPPVALGRLFRPFFRGAARSNKREGLGLGLYIANEIAKAHGGTLGVESTRQETRFTLRMPVG